MDGFGTGEERVFFLGATNRAEAIDEAALRRFGDAVEVGAPSLEARIALVRHLIDKAAKDGHRAEFSEEELQVVGEKMAGYSLADVDRLVRKAFLQDFTHEFQVKRKNWFRQFGSVTTLSWVFLLGGGSSTFPPQLRSFSATGSCCSAAVEEEPRELEAADSGPAMSEAPEALRKLQLKSVDDEDMKLVSHRVLEEDRRKVMMLSFPQLTEGSTVLAIIAQSPNGEQREFVAIMKGESCDLVTGSCSITFEDLTPSDCIEYCFPEAPSEWHMAQVSREALETYRGMKFDAWKQMLQKPTCEAQFRRMLQLGCVSELYDPQLFPTPTAFQSQYQVTDDRTGKLISLPHPVKELRVWDASKLKYEVIDTKLTGAPLQAEKDAWWKDFVNTLRGEHGDEYITGLLAGK
eukprot:symbB.v1.2.000681.t1/scaffold35.1/size400642/25